MRADTGDHVPSVVATLVPATAVMCPKQQADNTLVAAQQNCVMPANISYALFQKLGHHPTYQQEDNDQLLQLECHSVTQ